MGHSKRMTKVYNVMDRSIKWLITKQAHTTELVGLDKGWEIL